MSGMSEAGDGAKDARRKHGAPKNWKDVFISTLAESSNPEGAAQAAGIRLPWAYKCRREDPEFANRWHDALCEGYDSLEMELLYRLRSGKVEEVDEEGNKRKFDIATGFKILAAHREQQAKTTRQEDPQDEKALIDSINKKIEAMRMREKEVASMLARDGVMQPRVPNGTR
jgi:hypothetical protein